MMSVNGMRELVFRAKNGDSKAFDLLYREYITPIFRFIYLRVGQKQEAEDMTQTVFLKAWSALRGFEARNEGSFLSWCYTIARNLIVDYWRKKKPIPLETIGEDKEHISEPLEKTADLDFENQKSVIREAIRGLSPDQQEVIILKFINERSNKEIAKLIGKSEEAVRALSSRGIKALRGLLKDLRSKI